MCFLRLTLSCSLYIVGNVPLQSFLGLGTSQAGKKMHVMQDDWMVSWHFVSVGYRINEPLVELLLPPRNSFTLFVEIRRYRNALQFFSQKSAILGNLHFNKP